MRTISPSRRGEHVEAGFGQRHPAALVLDGDFGRYEYLVAAEVRQFV
jgi:hypothetical protein